MVWRNFLVRVNFSFLHTVLCCEIASNQIDLKMTFLYKSFMNSLHKTLYNNWNFFKVRPHKCEICGYGFSERRFMEKHIKAVHEKVKPVACEFCEYKCTTKDTLARHMWHKHEREPRFNCRLCDAKYMKRTLLESHYK